MKITVTGSLGNISRRLTQQLIAYGHTVTVISHDPEKAAAINALGAIPAIGSIEDVDFLIRAFQGADAVYTMVPPLPNAIHYREQVRAIAGNYAKAIEAAGVHYVVNLSSIGAHVPEGNGMSSVFYFEEKELYQVPGINLLNLRCGFFYTNYYGSMAMIRNMNLLGNNFGGDVKLALTHPHDIADAAAEALHNLSFKGKEVQYVVSDEKSGEEVAVILGKAVGKPNLRWVHFPDEDLKKGVIQNGFSDHMASLFVEVGQSINAGRIFEHYEQHKASLAGRIKLEAFAQEYSAAFMQQ